MHVSIFPSIQILNYVHLSIYLSIYLSIAIFNFEWINLSIYQSIQIFNHVHAYMYVYMYLPTPPNEHYGTQS